MESGIAVYLGYVGDCLGVACCEEEGQEDEGAALEAAKEPGGD